MILFLIACGSAAETTDTAEIALPIEVVDCSHPDSRFEGVVQVEVKDEVIWETVHFEISQGAKLWDTELQTEDQLQWWARMQLYELDCYSDFKYEVDYESR